MEWLQGITNTDQQLFLFLNGLFNDFFDTFMFYVTCKETWIPFYLVLLFYVFKTYRGKGFLIVLFLIAAIAASDQLANVFKDTVQRFRPVYEPSIQHLVHSIKKGGLYGFYSAHASNSFLLLTFTSYLFKNRLYKFTLLVFALMVSYSRIYLGVHYPGDILAGMISGIFLGWLFYKFMMFIEIHFFMTRQPKIKKTSLSLTSSATIFLAFIVMIATMLILTRHLQHFQLY